MQNQNYLNELNQQMDQKIKDLNHKLIKKNVNPIQNQNNEFINDINNNNPKKHSDFINIEKSLSNINIQKHINDLLNGITLMEPHIDDDIDKIDLDELIGMNKK